MCQSPNRSRIGSRTLSSAACCMQVMALCACGAQEDRLASPVIHQGLLFSATGSGILDVVEVATGKVLKRKRLELGEGRVDASLSLANGKLHIQSTNGTTVILVPNSDFPEVARNTADGSSSTAFFVNEKILFRTPTHMICISGV